MIDYRLKVSVPIRDLEDDGRIAFIVDVYGVLPKDLCVIPGGGYPMQQAVRRLKLDPLRYQAWIWDINVK